ncbi:MAG: hypothetical protein KatS3mg026_1854 [Bacteroidia bacterium]|nr:MAG: hypothetical protein KatS3mg026_1854 [Bacteroidia bacterium]
MRYAPFVGAFLAVGWAQLESPNSFLALSVGAASPTGRSAQKAFMYPTDGYALPGAAVGLHLHTFVAPYLSLNLRLTQSFFSLDAKSLGKEDHLFPEPVAISKNPTVSHTVVGFGVGTGFRLDWVSFYLPVQFALGIYALPEIQGVKSATQTWFQSKTSTAQVGFSTGLITNFSLSDDFFVGLSLLYTGVRSGEKEWERYRVTRGATDQRFLYRVPVATDLAEVGVLVGLHF